MQLQLSPNTSPDRQPWSTADSSISSGQSPMPLARPLPAWQFKTRSAMSHMPFKQRAPAGEHDAFNRLRSMPARCDFRAARSWNNSSARASRISISSPRRALARRAAFRRRHLDQAGIGGQAQQGAAVLLLQALGVLVGDLENGGDVAGEMVGSKPECWRPAASRRHHRSPARWIASPYPPRPRRARDPPGTGTHRRRPSAQRRSPPPAGAPDAPPRPAPDAPATEARDDVDVGFQARAHAFVRLAITGAAIQREILRQHVQQHAIAFQTDLAGQLHGVGQDRWR